MALKDLIRNIGPDTGGEDTRGWRMLLMAETIAIPCPDLAQSLFAAALKALIYDLGPDTRGEDTRDEETRGHPLPIHPRVVVEIRIRTRADNSDSGQKR